MTQTLTLLLRPFRDHLSRLIDRTIHNPPRHRLRLLGSCLDSSFPNQLPDFPILRTGDPIISPSTDLSVHTSVPLSSASLDSGPDMTRAHRLIPLTSHSPPHLDLSHPLEMPSSLHAHPAPGTPPIQPCASVPCSNGAMTNMREIRSPLPSDALLLGEVSASGSGPGTATYACSRPSSFIPSGLGHGWKHGAWTEHLVWTRAGPSVCLPPLILFLNPSCLSFSG